MKRFCLDYALAHDGKESGVYVVDMLAAPWQDVVARFLDEDDAVDYCDWRNSLEPGA